MVVQNFEHRYQISSLYLSYMFITDTISILPSYYYLPIFTLPFHSFSCPEFPSLKIYILKTVPRCSTFSWQKNCTPATLFKTSTTSGKITMPLGGPRGAVFTTWAIWTDQDATLPQRYCGDGLKISILVYNSLVPWKTEIQRYIEIEVPVKTICHHGLNMFMG